MRRQEQEQRERQQLRQRAPLSLSSASSSAATSFSTSSMTTIYTIIRWIIVLICTNTSSTPTSNKITTSVIAFQPSSSSSIWRITGIPSSFPPSMSKNNKFHHNTHVNQNRRQRNHRIDDNNNYNSNTRLRMFPLDVINVDVVGGAASASFDFLHHFHSSFSAAADTFHTSASSLMTASSSASSSPPPLFNFDLPFMDLGKELYENLDIGSSTGGVVGNDKLAAANTELVIESIGHDMLVFLLASVIVTPICTKFLNVTPILGYLIVGALLGPHGGLDLFSNSEGDIELGDFGILFLLFSEGLEVSSSRLKKLLQYLPLGIAQISLVTLVLTTGILILGEAVPDHRFISNSPMFHEVPIGLNLGPIEALVLALAVCLSTSAFTFPVLKERGWEDEESGEAATSILLLQDLMVAPLLVILPFLAAGAVAHSGAPPVVTGMEDAVIDGAAAAVGGGGGVDYAAIGFLTAKATLGFGAVIYVGSLVLQRVFALVAETGSAETFVALCLLVSAGMGEAAKMLGLTDTAGAFAAGVLLANTNYRAQIQADILPFKGILLGIFFMTAGSNFDVDLVVNEFPTILFGSLSLIVIKAVTLFFATRVPEWMERNRLNTVDAVRVSLLLSGGGEFAFVVLALAEKLEIIPQDLAGITTAIILITMGVTPILGEIADKVSQPLLALQQQKQQQEEINNDNNNNLLVSVAVAGASTATTTTTTIINDGSNNNNYDATAVTSSEVPLLDPAIAMTKVNDNKNGRKLMEQNEKETLSPLVVARDSVVICGYGEVGQALVQKLGKKEREEETHDDEMVSVGSSSRSVIPNIVAFDTSTSLLSGSNNNIIRPNPNSVVLFGNGRNAEVLRSYGIETPSAIFIAYEDHETVVDAMLRLRLFFPQRKKEQATLQEEVVPIYTRASNQREAQQLREAGATEVVIESNELPRLASQLLLSQQQHDEGEQEKAVVELKQRNFMADLIMKQQQSSSSASSSSSTSNIKSTTSSASSSISSTNNDSIITNNSTNGIIISNSSSADMLLQDLQTIKSNATIDNLWQESLPGDNNDDKLLRRLRKEASIASGISSLSTIDQLLEMYESFNEDGTGRIDAIEIEHVLDRSGRNGYIANDDEISKVHSWIERYVADTHPNDDFITAIELCCMYSCAPDYVQRAFGLNESKVKKKKKKKTKTAKVENETKTTTNTVTTV